MCREGGVGMGRMLAGGSSSPMAMRNESSKGEGACGGSGSVRSMTLGRLEAVEAEAMDRVKESYGQERKL